MIFYINNYLNDFGTEEDIKAKLKDKLSQYFNCRFSLPVSSGTVAIELVLKSMGLRKGSCVIIPDISFIATATAVANVGLIPVYADVSDKYYGMTLDSLVERYNNTPDVGAVIVVHFSGFVNRDIFKIKEFCDSKGIFLIEDCAQVFPCKIKGKSVGTIGHAGTFSFQSSKIVNSGEGGLIITDSPEIANKCGAFLNWGLVDNVRNFDIPSSNYRMSAIQCYFILKQLDMIDQIVEERLLLYAKIKEAFHSIGMETGGPEPEDDILDCPFFFPVKTTLSKYTVEPRGEYPMRISKLVQTIFREVHPDMLERYSVVNQMSSNCENLSSDYVIKNYDFINIKNVSNSPIEDLIVQYR